MEEVPDADSNRSRPLYRVEIAFKNKKRPRATVMTTDRSAALDMLDMWANKPGVADVVLGAGRGWEEAENEGEEEGQEQQEEPNAEEEQEQSAIIEEPPEPEEATAPPPPPARRRPIFTKNNAPRSGNDDIIRTRPRSARGNGDSSYVPIHGAKEWIEEDGFIENLREQWVRARSSGDPRGEVEPLYSLKEKLDTALVIFTQRENAAMFEKWQNLRRTVTQEIQGLKQKIGRPSVIRGPAPALKRGRFVEEGQQDPGERGDVIKPEYIPPGFVPPKV